MSVIYHIATISDWEQACRAGCYSTSTRGQTMADQGFIHGSTADQVAPVANMIYQGEPGLVVLVIETDRVGPEIRWEQVPGWDAPFPHIYGPLNADAVVGTRPLVPGPDGRFSFDATGTETRSGVSPLAAMNSGRPLRPSLWSGRHGGAAGPRSAGALSSWSRPWVRMVARRNRR